MTLGCYWAGTVGCPMKVCGLRTVGPSTVRVPGGTCCKAAGNCHPPSRLYMPQSRRGPIHRKPPVLFLSGSICWDQLSILEIVGAGRPVSLGGGDYGPARWRAERLNRHPTAYLMAELFERHDRSRFEVIGVSFGVDDKSDMRRRLVAAFDQFYDVRTKSDEEVAKLLHDLQVDIAIDLKGYTQDSRPGILAYRPTPIQASYLGFPGTTGAEFIDYIIADETVLPFDHQPFYAEKIVHLPDCYQVNDTKQNIAERTPTRQEAGLPEKGCVFCCFNNNWKITPEVFSVWIRLLHAVEGSVLWLFRADRLDRRDHGCPFAPRPALAAATGADH